MKMHRLFAVLLVNLILSWTGPVKADEGMWLPALLDRLNITRMQELGMKLSARDIYDVNQACIKDAVLIFGNGCTAEIVSPEGLLFTNHHCGFQQIQEHSSVDHDYITNGFWAMTRKEELPNPGLTVTFLIRMEDVTNKVLEASRGLDSPEQKKLAEQTRMIRIEDEAIDGTDYKATVRPLFYGNQYLLFVYQQYKDIRLVGAPPGAIGKFGGDTDNWVWPRHTGDFSIFRIYAGKNNEPADYSPDNIPFKPKKYLPISLKGVHENDFTMVMGYPGSTQEFMASYGVRLQIEQSMPCKIALRDIVLEEYNRAMKASDKVRIQYASKQAGMANAWKKWIGSEKGLQHVDALSKKTKLEQSFAIWCKASRQNDSLYGSLLPAFSNLYGQQAPYLKATDYFQEAVLRIELVRFASQFASLITDQGTINDKAKREKSLKVLKSYSRDFYKDYYQPLDRILASRLVQRYIEDVNSDFQPEAIKQVSTKYKGNYDLWADRLMGKSIFSDSTAIYQILDHFSSKLAEKLSKDPVWLFYKSCAELYNQKVYPVMDKINGELNGLYARYVRGLMQMDSSRHFYPDANFTMRVAYGKVSPYSPEDAVHYGWYTTLDGIIQKEDPAIADYSVPERLKDLWKNKDFGPYGVDGTMPVCFIASNHTSGGNSGSPVLNANGELIGINFDRNWEGTMSDILYDSSICRNISVDIRYVLFIIDKYAGASNLLNELTLVRN